MAFGLKMAYGNVAYKPTFFSSQLIIHATVLTPNVDTRT